MEIEQLKRYVELKEQIKELEAELDPINKEIKTRFKNEAGVYTLDDYSVELTTSSRESFDLKKASLELDNTILKPYIKVSNVVTLKVNKIKKAEAA